MSLTRVLKNQGYDLISGPDRNHKILQLWRMKGTNAVEFYLDSIMDVFESDVNLQPREGLAFDVQSIATEEYKFKLGMTFFSGALKATGLGRTKLDSEIFGGKTVKASYEDAITNYVSIGEVSRFLSQADFVYTNHDLMNDLNRNNILLISGVILAKRLVLEVSADKTFQNEFVSEIENLVEGDVSIKQYDNNMLKIESISPEYFPIAVKAERIDFDKSIFKRTVPITDTKDIF